MLKRGDKVYTQIVKNRSVSELMLIIKGKADTYSVLYSDGFKTYDELVDYGYKKHFRIKHGDNKFANERNPMKTFGDWLKSGSQSLEEYINILFTG